MSAWAVALITFACVPEGGLAGIGLHHREVAARSLR